MDNSKADIDFEYHTIDLMDHLGQGAFGVVYRGFNKSTKETVAAKRVNVGAPDKSDSFGQGVMREIKTLQKINIHPHIIHLLDYHYAKQCFWLIMEFCEKGDLQVYTKKNKPEIDFTIDIMLQTTSALKFLHDNQVIHRDMKPGNILLREQEEKIMAKITDFGFSKIGDKSKSDEEWLLSSDVGTFAYKAPEFYDQNIQYTKTVDIFSLGLILLALILFEEGKTRDQLIPKSVKAIKKGNMRTIGQEMYDAHDDERPIPEIVEIKDSDGHKVKECKHLVKKLCTFTPSDRLPLQDALDELSVLSGNAVPRPKEKELSDVDLALKFANEAIVRKWDMKCKEINDKETVQKASEMFNKMGLDQKLVFVNGIGMDSSEIKAGDMVKVETDRPTFEQQQQGYGGYTPDMAKLLGQTGKVTGKILHVFSVKFGKGEKALKYLFNAKNLTKVSEDDFVQRAASEGKTQTFPIQENDIVRICKDEETVKQSHASGKIGWNDRMRDCLGYSGIVLGVRSNGSVTVRCINGEIWIYNPDILTKLDLSNAVLETADLVIVTRDKVLLERLQREQGGWKPKMEKKSGKLGLLREILEAKSCLVVEIGGEKWTFNKKAISLVASAAEYLSATTKENSDESDQDIKEVTEAISASLTIR